MAEQRFTVIEIGGGDKPTYCRKYGNGTNLDVRPMETVDIVCDFEKPLPLPSNEYDMVYSAYCVEHVSWRNIRNLISEIYRVLKANGKAVIITANLLEQCKVVANSQVWDENFSCMIFGNLDYADNSHKCGFSPEYAVKLFKEAGFATVNVNPLPQCQTDLTIQAIKGSGRAMTLLELFKSHYDPKEYHHIGDADVFTFAQEFNEPIPSTVLEIGANDEPASNILALAGYTVFGVDLKPYMNRVNLPLNFTFIQADFNLLRFDSPFDAIVSLSTIEHVGLGPYGETPYADGDILTMENVYNALRNGGRVYLTVPVGIHQVPRDWRVYDKNALKHRLIGRFNVVKTRYFTSGKIGAYDIGEDIPEEVAFKQIGPNATVLLVLQKNSDQEIKR
ncbi:methyltransferase domain-containing protein [Candidatus Bathyarchaeota archaeon]|nr:methyltransferase domain-containing protein [Candidatus Bathyarchaeota archaeon]